jgi:hypothetical protein
LLKVETAFCPRGLSLGFVGIFQRGIALRSRIQSIATQPNPHPIMKITLSLCIVLLTFLGVTKAAPPDTNALQVLMEAKSIEVSKKAKIEIGREFAYKDADGKSATKTLIPKPAAEKNPLQAKQEASPAEVQANKIILPKVQFQEATLTEAVEFLRVKSRELDPEKKGLNILVKPGGNPNDRITMQLKDVPAYEALRYCAEIAGHQLSAGENAFILSPLVEK